VQISRRRLIRSTGLLSIGAVAGIGGKSALDRAPTEQNTAGPERQPTVIGSERGYVTVSWSVEMDQKLVALTFDDGPVPEYTPLVLDALHDANISATFFFVGQRLEAHAGLVRGRLNRHEVGNHTWSHKDLGSLSFDAAYAEIERGHESIVRILGREPRLFRPPSGHLSDLALRAADRFRYEIVLWSQGVTEADFQTRPDSVVPFITDNIVPGAIFLAHDAVADGIQPVFLRRIGAVVADLRQKGYQFVTVSELLSQRAPNTVQPAAQPSRS
jgi:peptidoglycan/xylan/chitin deacetylase (PgdA/CDA1 family)